MRHIASGIAFFALVAAAPALCAQPADAPAYLQIELGAHAAPVRRIAVDAARQLVATGADDKTARLWSLASGESQRVLRPPVGAGEIGRVYGVALHPSRPWLALGGTTGTTAHWIYLYDAGNGQALRRFDARGGHVKRLVWSPDGTRLFAAYAGDHAVRAFDIHGAPVFEDRFDAAVYALAVAKQRWLAAAALDGTLRVYELAGGSVVARAQWRLPARHPVSLAFSPDGARLAVGYFLSGKAPDVIAWASGEVRALAAPPRLGAENLMAVAWTPDDRIAAGGSYGSSERKVPLVFYDATGRSAGETAAARLSIADLVAVDDGRIAYAATDGSWGIAGSPALAQAPRLPDLLGAANLRASADGGRLSFTLDGGSQRVLFDLAQRRLLFGQGADLPGARLRRGLFDAPSDWENLPAPVVNGVRIALAPDEVARAVALFAQGRDAALGTSRALYRIGGDGRVLWRIAVPTEVRAVLVAREDRLLVTAMLDGTVRLWRAEDGQELLALLVLRDGRWVMWTPGGHFDASVGADALVGWVVNRGAHADYFPVARLRERFHLPAYIDRLLETLDFAQAARQHRTEVERELGAAVAAAATAPPRPRPEQLPPVLLSPLAGELRLDARDRARVVELPFAVTSETPIEKLAFEARLDGRPAQALALAPPPRADGKALGTLKLEVPPAATSLQVLARDSNGYSEPLSVKIVRPASAAPRMPRLFLLAIGISDYARPELQLGLAAKDARDFAAALRAQQGKFYREVHARVLVDRDARRDAISAALKWLAGAAAKDDVAMLFIAGHGVTSAAGKYYFLPQDVQPDRLAATAIVEDEIRDALRAVAGRAVFFVDTCFAGKAVGELKNRNRELSRFVNDLASAENGVVVFAASSGRQLSAESDDWGNGAFTHALLQGLAGRADLLRSGQITYKGLDYFVSEEVKRLTNGMQTPVSLSPWGVPDFALAAT
jgi:WD40 repeat protein